MAIKDAKTVATKKASGGVKATASAAARAKHGDKTGGDQMSHEQQLGVKGSGLKRRS